MVTKEKKRTYCAIYTRKSTSEGLDQDFTTLDAQRESAENYIASQKSEGWVPIQEQYNDGGFTGANIERPALQKLLSDIKEYKVNCVVVYKVDRLSRSLMDFSQLLEFFEKHNVTFVSVTQHFNTNSSMGRLTLNVLLSFAQFEREIISERTKDKMGAARRKGKWTGGRPPLGYDLDRENKRIVVNKEESNLVKEIFDLYIKERSLLQVAIIINDKGHRTKRMTYNSGKTYGGKKFGVTHVQFMISNVVYLGKVNYGGQIYEGQHDDIVSEDTFKQAQETMKQNRVERKVTKNHDCTGLLSKLLHCNTCNTFMFHTYTLKKSTHKYRYYLCCNAQKRGYASCPTKSINAQAVEDVTIDRLKTIFSDQNIEDHHHNNEIEALLSPVWDTLFPQEKRRVLKVLIKAVDYNAENKKMGITLRENNLRLEYDVDLKGVRPLKKWYKEREIDKEPKLKKNLVLAHQLQSLIDEGKIENPKQSSTWLNLSPARIDQLMNMLLLSPSIQEEIINMDNGKLDSIPEYKLREVTSEIDWNKQQVAWRELLESSKK